GLLHHGVDLGAAGDVALHDDRAPAQVTDVLADALGRRAVVEEVHGDVGALAGQRQRDGPADALLGTGDETNLAGEPHRSVPATALAPFVAAAVPVLLALAPVALVPLLAPLAAERRLPPGRRVTAPPAPVAGRHAIVRDGHAQDRGRHVGGRDGGPGAVPVRPHVPAASREGPVLARVQEHVRGRARGVVHGNAGDDRE